MPVGILGLKDQKYARRHSWHWWSAIRHSLCGDSGCGAARRVPCARAALDVPPTFQSMDRSILDRSLASCPSAVYCVCMRLIGCVLSNRSPPLPTTQKHPVRRHGLLVFGGGRAVDTIGLWHLRPGWRAHRYVRAASIQANRSVPTRHPKTQPGSGSGRGSRSSARPSAPSSCCWRSCSATGSPSSPSPSVRS